MEKDGFKVSRLGAGGLHLLISAVLLSVLLVCMHFTGYAWPVWYLQGVHVVFAMVAFVDLCLGPTMTLIVTNPKKTRRSLLQDWSFIAVVQIAALAYGVFTLWEGRPVAVVVSVGSADVITANAIEPKRLPSLQSKCAAGVGAELLPNWHVCRMVARLPDDPKKQQDILFSALSGGPDIPAMPEYYLKPGEGTKDTLAAMKTVSALVKSVPTLAAPIKAALSQHKLSEADVRVLWVLGRDKSAALIYKTSDHTLLDTVVE